MSKKLKITEEQLKRLVVNNKNIQEQQAPQEEEVEVGNELNESVKGYKNEFERFLKGPKQ